MTQNQYNLQLWCFTPPKGKMSVKWKISNFEPRTLVVAAGCKSWKWDPFCRSELAAAQHWRQQMHFQKLSGSTDYIIIIGLETLETSIFFKSIKNDPIVISRLKCTLFKIGSHFVTVCRHNEGSALILIYARTLTMTGRKNEKSNFLGFSSRVESYSQIVSLWSEKSCLLIE